MGVASPQAQSCLIKTLMCSLGFLIEPQNFLFLDTLLSIHYVKNGLIASGMIFLK